MRVRANRIAMLALLAGAAVLALLVSGGDDDYRVRVQVSDAAGLRKDFLVKIAGAPVGKVISVDLDAADHAVAVLRLDDGAGPIGTDARAAVRASNLLGEKYVDLVPGDAAARPARSGFEIRESRTSTPSDLDDVLSVLDPDTRVALSAFLVSQGEALTGRGTDLGTALLRMPPTLDAAGALVAGLAKHNRELGTLVERSDRIVTTLASRRTELGELVTSADGAFGTLDGRRAALGRTVERAPGAIRQLRGSLVQLQRAAQPLGPAARGLTATAAPLTATLDALPAFVDAARPTLQTARSVAPTLRRLGQQAAPVVIRLRPAAAGLRTLATALQPVTKVADNGIADTLGVMQGWARSIQNRDNAGHVFRVSVELGGDQVTALNQYVRAPLVATNRRPARHPGTASPAGGQPASAAPAPALPKITLPKLSLPKITAPKLPKITLPGQDRPVGDAVSQLLDSLLGQ